MVDSQPGANPATAAIIVVVALGAVRIGQDEYEQIAQQKVLIRAHMYHRYVHAYCVL